MTEYNLLEHLEEVMDEGEKGWGDVVWVGNFFGYVNKEKFIEFAKNFNFYITPKKLSSGYQTGVCKGLIISGEGWWIEWNEGYGIFEFLCEPLKPKKEEINIAKIVDANYREGTYFQGELEFDE